MNRDAVDVARRIVRQRFPMARAAWLGGSVADGTASSTSDLDITVLLDGPPAPFRESVTVSGWPVELFVQTSESLMRFCDSDIQRRRPTTMRLVGSSLILVDTDGVGLELRQRLHSLDRAGPDAATTEQLENARYLVTDGIDDLADPVPGEVPVLAAGLWTATAELMLLANRHWSGSGKWLLRELRSLDRIGGTTYGDRLVGGLRAAVDGDAAPLRSTVEALLGLCGGRLFDGYRRESSDRPRNDVHPATAPVTLRLVHPDHDVVPVRCQIISSGDGTVGAVDVERTETTMRILRLELLPESRSRGLGSRLVVDLLDQARHEGLRVTVNVPERDTGAQRFYRRMGFVESARSSGQVELGQQRFAGSGES